jgi:hypothetical protein
MSKGKAIERAMSLDAQHRFSSVEQFREALWRLEEHDEEDPTPTVRLPKPPLGVRVPGSDEEEEDPTPTVRLPKLPSIAPAGVKEPEDLDVATYIPQL